MMLIRSAVYRMNKSGPRMDPCVLRSIQLLMWTETRLHYSNATLAGLPEHHHHRLQSDLPNAAARLIYRTSRCQHVTPLLWELLAAVPRTCRLQTRHPYFHCLHGLAPRYLTDNIRRVADTNHRCLRSSSSAVLTVRSTRLVTMGDRAFPVFGS